MEVFEILEAYQSNNMRASSELTHEMIILGSLHLRLSAHYASWRKKGARRVLQVEDRDQHTVKTAECLIKKWGNLVVRCSTLSILIFF